MKILYITPFIPYAEISHAGGFFLYQYLRELSKHVEIVLLAPRTSENEYAAEQSKDWLRVELVGKKTILRSKWVRGIPLIWNSLFNPIEIGQFSALVAYVRDSGVLHDVDLVELQFSQTLPLVKKIKEIREDLPVIVFQHDVYTQSIRRRAIGTPFTPNKILNLLKLLRVGRIESALINECDGAFVFSDKDKTLLNKMEIRKPIEVLSPSIDLPSQAAELDGEPICLFVGAMQRSENSEAAFWFITDIWPSVLERVPTARLKIVGANPPQELIDQSNPNVTVTGFVETMAPYYEEASVCIAPLLTGAGVKFKVLQAMAYGLPIVSTPVGVEGISGNEKDANELFPYVTTDVQCFAEGVVRYLSNENLRKSNGSRLREWVKKNYNFDKNTIQRALAFYDSLSLAKET